MEVWLCDLTYTQQSISSDAIPYAIGGIASYINEKADFKIELKIIKYPDDLTKKIEKLSKGESEPPQFIGFSNYLWNFNISYKFASLIKELKIKNCPKIIFGGPNFPIEEIEQFEFLKKQFPKIDWTYHSYRNSDPDIMQECIQNLINGLFISVFVNSGFYGLLFL